MLIGQQAVHVTLQGPDGELGCPVPMCRTALLRQASGESVSRKLASLAELLELWHLPLRRGKAFAVQKSRNPGPKPDKEALA
jgi:hypothetical protein